MKSKFLIPLLAVIFTTAMSFTTARTVVNPDFDFISTDAGVVRISEMQCGAGTLNCSVQLEPNGTEYQVFDDEDLTVAKNTNNPNPIELF
ncbi:DUF6520 family protein [Mesonia aestuariivivens]|uniref:Secreted protein n=1 Tax=Mesonia aestuariivivens TaxID=2796128 RepID=A0ABS6W1W6_9FLAO|nr:DUF6520 family protein [Mesonia aestuariivivens]MBW2961842.1 hypothetical protein [Mesonia aestuariivivens]